MEIKQLIDEAIRKKLGIKDGLHVERATVTVCAGSDDVEIESVFLMTSRPVESVDRRPPPTPKPTSGCRGGRVSLRGKTDIKRNLNRSPARQLATRRLGNCESPSVWQKHLEN